MDLGRCGADCVGACLLWSAEAGRQKGPFGYLKPRGRSGISGDGDGDNDDDAKNPFIFYNGYNSTMLDFITCS